MTMDIRNVELSIEDILSIHRHWVTKLYLDDKKSEAEIVDLLYERRLPVTVSQIQNCLSEWDLISSPPVSRRGSDTSTLSSLSSRDFEAFRSPSPTSSTTSISSIYSAPAENIALYLKRPLPSLPTTASSSSRPSSSASHIHPALRTSGQPPSRNSSHSNLQHRNHSQKRFNNTSSRDLLRVTCHHSSKRSYEVEMTLGVLPKKGPSPLDLYTSHSESHERIAVGLKKTECPSPRKMDGGSEFEWLRQYTTFGASRAMRREVKILQGSPDDELDI